MPLSAEDVDVTGCVTISFAVVYVLNAGEDSNVCTQAGKISSSPSPCVLVRSACSNNFAPSPPTFTRALLCVSSPCFPSSADSSSSRYATAARHRGAMSKTLDVASIAQTMFVGAMDLDQIFASPAATGTCTTRNVRGIQTISHVKRTEIHPESFLVAVYVPVHLPGMCGAGVDAMVLATGFGVDPEPLAAWFRGWRRWRSRRTRRRARAGFGARTRRLAALVSAGPWLLLVQLLLPALHRQLAAQPMEVVQIGIGIVEQFSEGIVVLPIFHHVPDRPDATDLGADGLVFQLQLHGSLHNPPRRMSCDERKSNHRPAFFFSSVKSAK